MFTPLPKVTPTLASQCASANLPANRSTAKRPPLFDYGADYDIPKLWRDKDVNGIPRSVARELTPGERAHVERRRDELVIGCSPFSASEEDRAITALAEMLGGFRAMQRQGDEAAVAGLEAIRRLIAEFPVWAIEEACQTIRTDSATIDGKRLNPEYAPNDNQVYRIIKELVAPYEQLRARAVALLNAPLQEKETR